LAILLLFLLCKLTSKTLIVFYQNNFVRISKIMSNAAKDFDILVTNLNVLHHYFDSSIKLLL